MSVNEDVEKSDIVCIAVRNVKCCRHCGKQYVWQILKKLTQDHSVAQLVFF